jgi:signal transduction histidine kinase
MLRNREIRIFILLMSSISLIGMIIASFISVKLFVIVGVIAILLNVCSLLFTRWRYREIEKLSQYLRKIAGGDYTLDVRDNQEGELSILKNDIYKVTMMLSEQRSGLEDDKRQLTTAISDISHQLKTPLTSMMMMADLLNDPHLSNQKRTEFIQNLQNQLDRMEWLISSLLKLSKIDAGTVHFKKERILVHNLLDKVVEPFLIPLDIKEQNLSISGETSASFMGDFNWTKEALTNIVKNCLEHTGIGGELSVTFSENALFTEIVITDNGTGIEREDLPYIFKRFYKGKNASEDSVGIGLAMAHSIITSQNGDIIVDSTIGKGTRFQIKFYKQVI